MILLVVGASFLMATVGPASAACMIPRAADWPAYPVTVGVNLTMSELFPVNLTMSLYNTTSGCETRYLGYAPPYIQPCPWANSSDNIVSLAVATEQSNPLPGSNTNQASTWLALVPSYAYGLLEYLPTALTLYDTLEADYTNAVATSTQPLAFAAPFVSWYWDMNIQGGYDAYSWVQMTGDAVLWQDLSSPAPPLPFNANGTTTSNWMTESDQSRILTGLEEVANGSTPYYNDFFYVALNDSLHTAGIVMATSASDAGYYDLTQGVWLSPFILRLGWLPVEWQLRGQTVLSSPAPTQPPPDLVPVTFSADWFRSVQGVAQGTNVTTFEVLINGWQPQNLTVDAAAQVLLMVSTLFTASLSNMVPAPREDQVTADYDLDFSDYKVTYPGMIFQSGYGYGDNSLTVQLSLAIIIVFCLIVVAHCVYSIGTGISSSAWDSVSEIAVLCLNSRVSPEVNNACAGIQSIHLFQHPVRIAVTEGTVVKSVPSSPIIPGPNTLIPLHEPETEHLEILFPSGSKAAIDDVVPNKPYGQLKLKVE